MRLHDVRGAPGRFGVFVSCNTTLVATYRSLYPDLYAFDGRRALIFRVEDPLPVGPLSHCLALALRYHRDRKEGLR